MVQPTNNDYELLSAYLDDALSDAARAALDARLENDPTLRQALEDLRVTVRILRAAPQVIPPRNFTLDPARYQRRAPWWMRGGLLQFAGAVGALASILLIAASILFSSVIQQQRANSVAYQMTVGAVYSTNTAVSVALQSTSTAKAWTATLAPALSMTPRLTATPMPTTTFAPTSVPSPLVSSMPPTQTVVVATNRQAPAAAAPGTGPEPGQSGSGGAVNGAVAQSTQAAAAALNSAPAESPTSSQANDQAAQESPSHATVLAAAKIPTELTGTPTAPDTAFPSPAPSPEAMKSDASEGAASPMTTPIPGGPTSGPQFAVAATMTPLPSTSIPFPQLSPTASVTPVSVAKSSPPPTIPWLLVGGIALLVFSLMLLGIGLLRSRL